MQYLSGIYTDIGIKKKMNQDAAMVRVAETKKVILFLQLFVMEWVDWKRENWPVLRSFIV